MSYKIITPDTNVENYTENQNIVFSCLIDKNEQLKQGSIAVCGELETLINGNPLSGTENLFLDPLSGIHSTVQMITTKFNNNTAETLNEYARYAHMYFEGTQDALNIANEAQSQMELRSGYDYLSDSKFLCGEMGLNALSFAFYPLCSANRTLQPITDTNINLTIQLRPTQNSYYGTSNVTANNISYQWKNVKLMYITEPLANGSNKFEYVTMDMLKTSLSSSSANLLLAPTGNLISIAGSFISQANENSSILNNLKTEIIPNFKELEFFVNGGELKTKFPIKSLDECLLNYIQALKYGKFKESNCVYIDQTGQGFGVGLFLGSPVQMGNGGRINLKLISGIIDPFLIYVYYTRIETVQ